MAIAATTTALIDERLAPALGNLTHGRPTPESALALVSLFSLLESLVLYDRCEISYWAIDAFGWPISDPLLGPFMDAGVLTMREHRDDHFIDQIRTRDDRFLLLDSAMTIRHTAAALGKDMHYVPPIIGQWHHTIDMLDNHQVIAPDDQMLTRIRHAVGAIASATGRGRVFEHMYGRLRDGLNARTQTEIAFGASIPVVIPPIAQIVLSDARNSDEIARKALDLRESLATYRAKMNVLVATIDDPDLTNRERTDRIQTLSVAIESLVGREYRDFMSAVPMAQTTGLATALATQSPAVGVAITGLIAKILEDAHPGKWWTRRKIAFLSEIAHRFDRVKNLNGLIHKHFGFTPDAGEFQEVERLAQLGRGGSP